MTFLERLRSSTNYFFTKWRGMVVVVFFILLTMALACGVSIIVISL